MKSTFRSIGAFALACWLSNLPADVLADQIELSNGTLLEGTIQSWEGDAVVADVVVGSRSLKRTYPKSRLRSITVGGRKIDMATGKEISASTPTRPITLVRTEAEVLQDIETTGKTPPDWFESTELNFPPTLDMSWEQPKGQGWDSSRNVGQFVWDRIHPNENQWRNGVKLMHHVLAENKDPEVQQRAMRTLGNMYHNLHEDYLRAAFWYRQSGLENSPAAEPQAFVHLADCYWKLGSKTLAMKTIKQMKSKPYIAIKLLGDMGETESALKMAEQFSKTGEASTAFLYAGDVCRVAGRLDDAKKYYQKAIDSITEDIAEKPHRKRDRARAEASLQAVDFYTLNPAQIRDGQYSASSIGYEGPVEVSVTVGGGKIQEVRVSKHQEKQFYSSIADTPRKILQRQSVHEIDATSGATITSEAIINATAKALATGKK